MLCKCFVFAMGERLVFAECVIFLVKKCYVEQAVAPSLSGTVSKAVAQH